MIKKYLFSLSVLFAGASAVFAATQEEIAAAQGVISRFMGKNAIPVVLKSLPEKDGCPTFETSANGSKITIKGSDGVALCRGFYDFVKSRESGICSWSGTRFSPSKDFVKSAPAKRVSSPVPYHYYYNVVSYGYTMPYWDKARWDREIDWMALHGVNMPLALIANEAIAARVWKKLGLTDEEIRGYFVGPAHFPWMRMGNISGLDSPLPQDWLDRQIEMQHYVLKKMKALGMKPICPGFAGFVPQAMKRVHPEIELVETRWNVFKNWMLSPDQPLFRKIGKMYIEEWEKEFGKNDFYIIDSFNEMDIPFGNDPEARRKLLTLYGDNVYSALKDGNPDAVWVMQGWMFGYQRGIWTPANLAALLERVPDDKMLLLDLAADYNKHFWRNGMNWDLHKGFYNKLWVYSVIPNMGGKSAPTGVLEFYANGHLEALNSENRGRLSGFGFAPEGIENNEVIYELLCDAHWSGEKTDLQAWLENYSENRYGSCPEEIKVFWEKMLQSVYGSFTDHPRFCWQMRPGGTRGSVRYNDAFFEGIESFAAAAKKLHKNPLYRADLAEWTAFYAGAKLEILIGAIERAHQNAEFEQEKEWRELANEIFIGIDKALWSHPTLSLVAWEKLAARDENGKLAKNKDYYLKNARRIITIWGPPVDDYAAKIWGGLVGDYYRMRWNTYWEARDAGKPSKLAEVERAWVETPRAPISLDDRKPANAKENYAFIQRLKKEVSADKLKSSSSGEAIGSWSPDKLESGKWSELKWSVSPQDLRNSKGVRFTFTRGNHRLDISEVSIEMDGKIVQKISRNAYAGNPSRGNTFLFKIPEDATGNNSCTIRARVRGGGGNESNGTVELLMKK